MTIQLSGKGLPSVLCTRNGKDPELQNLLKANNEKYRAANFKSASEIKSSLALEVNLTHVMFVVSRLVNQIC